MGNLEQFCLKKKFVSIAIPIFLKKKYRFGEYEIGDFVWDLFDMVWISFSWMLE